MACRGTGDKPLHKPVTQFNCAHESHQTQVSYFIHSRYHYLFGKQCDNREFRITRSNTVSYITQHRHDWIDTYVTPCTEIYSYILPSGSPVVNFDIQETFYFVVTKTHCRDHSGYQGIASANERRRLSLAEPIPRMIPALCCEKASRAEPCNPLY